MIVECQNCTTRFQLDELLIPLAGIRVRCSKCKEAFFLEHPSASPDEVVDQVAFDAVASGSPASLGSTQDLIVPPRGGGVEEDDDNWEFNHDGIGDAVVPNFDPAADPGASLRSDSTSKSVELAAELDATSQVNVAHEQLDEEMPSIEVDTDTSSVRGTASDEVAFDSLEIDIARIDGVGIDDSGAPGDVADSVECKDSFDRGSVFDHSVAGDLAGSVHPDGSSTPDMMGASATDLGAGSVTSASDSFGQIADEVVHGELEVEAVAEDLGDPEDWDLLGDDLLSSTLSTSPRETPPAKSSATTQTPSPDAAATDASVSASAAMPRRKPTLGLQSGLRYAGNAVGWGVTLGLLALTLGLGAMRSISIDPSSTAAAFPVGVLRAQSIQTEWFPTTQGGTLLVVRGELHNPTSTSVKSPLAVIVSLLDSEGVPLDLSGVAAGRPLDPDMLRDLSADGRERFADEARAALLAASLHPEKSVPFAAYFSDIPVEAQRVSVRGIEQEHPSASELVVP
ncbi:MAG: zinc-ribbon domain-containing protein [Myxococcota bacterium]|nr:zinc-ribbon domain-containing protein [Myxococcota bacterium]